MFNLEKESQNLEDSSRHDEKKHLESPEQNISNDAYKLTEENKREDNNKESIEDKLSYDVGRIIISNIFFKFS